MRIIFELLSIFDWITPLADLVEDVINDPTPFQLNSWTFFIPYDQSIKNGWNATDIKKLMHYHGVKAWGRQVVGGEFFFSVKLEQAQWAEYLLLKHGVPIHERSQGAPRSARTNKSQWQPDQGKDLVTQFFEDFFSFDQTSPTPANKQNRTILTFLDDFFG